MTLFFVEPIYAAIFAPPIGDEASTLFGRFCSNGGIGRHEGLKIPWLHGRAGSSPASSTNPQDDATCRLRILFYHAHQHPMTPLNLPPANLKIMEIDGLTKVFDPYRKKYVKLTPEEYVRQNFLAYLTNHLRYPYGLTAVEHEVVINNLRQRADIVVYDTSGHPLLIVECKAPDVEITQNDFDQALRYNTRLGVRLLVLTNGLRHYCALINQSDNGTNVTFLKEIPPYEPPSVKK